MCSNAASFALGAYDVPSAPIDTYVVYTDNPPCGAMRGFGAVQACFAHEAQMDKLAAALELDPVELRLRNAMTTGTSMPTGAADQLPRAGTRAAANRSRRRALPGRRRRPTAGRGSRTSRTAKAWCAGRLRHRVQNIGFSEGFDDFSTARVRLSLAGGEPLVEVHTAAAEVGQGLVTVMDQIARTEFGVQNVLVLPADTQVGSAGSSSASRQTHMTGGAVQAACRAVKAELEQRGGEIGDGIEATREYHHRPTQPLDERGQGDAHVTFAFAAHRAVVDVDTELGLVRVVRDRHGAGRRQGDEPTRRRGPDRGRDRAGRSGWR